MKTALNVKNMADAMIAFGEDGPGMNKVWQTFYHLYTMGFITRDEWTRFYDKCKGWYVTEETEYNFSTLSPIVHKYIRDSERDDEIVYEYE